ncbi:MAG: hypothetical protein Q9181_002041 [Wetmoreana brouardii]
MSLPGLQISAPIEPIVATAIHEIPAETEWRFEVAFGSKVDVKLLSGTAEIFGTELAQKQIYTFSGAKAAVFTWHGCTIEVAGDCQVEYLAEETPMMSYANLHLALENSRDEATSTGRDGPRVLVLGPEDAGKTSLAKLLTAYATRCGRQPLAVNLDPKEGLLSVPGTLSAAAFSSIIDVEEGWGSSPTNGPNQIPVKLPLVYYYGQSNPEDSSNMYKPLVTRLALATMSRLQEDADAKGTGVLIDTPGAISQGKGGYDIIQHIVSEFSVNVLVVVGSERLYSDMLRRFNGQRIGADETTVVIKVDRSGGTVDRDDDFLRHHRQAQVRAYFFGDPKISLSPHTQQVDFSQLSVHRVPEGKSKRFLPILRSFCIAHAFIAASEMLAFLLPGGEAEEPTQKPIYEKVQPSPQMQNGILAIVQADINDKPENIRDASVIGFLYVAEVDEKKRKLRVLSPMSGRIPHRAMVWGFWPADVGELPKRDPDKSSSNLPQPFLSLPAIPFKHLEILSLICIPQYDPHIRISSTLPLSPSPNNYPLNNNDDRGERGENPDSPPRIPQSQGCNQSDFISPPNLPGFLHGSATQPEVAGFGKVRDWKDEVDLAGGARAVFEVETGGCGMSPVAL